MTKRKTIRVLDLKTKINGYLLRPSVTQAEKQGMCFVLETVLHQTGNYLGYGWAIGCQPFFSSPEGKREPNPGHQEYSRYYY